MCAMKKTILTAALALFAAWGLRAQDAQAIRTALGSQSEWLASFSAIAVDAPLDLRLVRVAGDEAPRIVYDTKGSYTSKFKAVVKEGTLRITERPASSRLARTEVTVYYNELRQLTATDATVLFADTLRTTLLDLTAGGQAKLTAAVDCADLTLEISGKSEVLLTGKARYLSAFVSTGKLEAGGLETLSSQINAQSGGDASVWVTDRIEAKTTTNGRVVFRGHPAVIRGGSKFMGGAIMQVEEIRE